MTNIAMEILVEQSPTLALSLACIVAFVWLIKNLQEIKSKRYVSKLNKEVLSITLSSVKSKELIENLLNLQGIVSEIESSSITISDRIFFNELKLLNDSLGQLVKSLPDDWEFRKELTVQHDWVVNFIELNNSTKKAVDGVIGKDEKLFYLTTEQLSKKSSTVFFSIDELINLITQYNEKSKSTIDWVATAKGAGALCILLVFSYGLVSTVNLQEELTLTSNQLSENSTAFEQEMSELKYEILIATTRYTRSEQIVERLTQELATMTRPDNEKKEDEKPVNTENEFMIKINWNNPSDLDLMLMLPNGEAISYQQAINNEYTGVLKGDIRRGPGEEIIIVSDPQPGLYVISVSNFSKIEEIEFEIERISNGTVIWKDDDKVNEKPKTYQFNIN